MTRADLLDHPLIEQRYFFPRREPPTEPFWVAVDGARLACSYHETDPTARTVVHFHGNGEVVADYLDGFPQLINAMGCNCLLAEYRGYGGSSGRPQLGRMLDDVPQVMNALGQPAEQLVVFGRSVGSLFATRAIADQPDLAGLILESAIADPLERLLLRVTPEELGTDRAGLVAAVREQLAIESWLGRYAGPTLLLHTRHDGLIDVGHAERLAAWCAGPTQLQIFPEGCHNDIMFVNGPHYFSLLRDFLAAL